MKTDQCSTAAKKDDSACKALATKLVAEKKEASTANAAVTAQQKTMKSGFPVGAIIGIVAGVVIIGGGVAWYCHDKKKKEGAFEAKFSADDNYKSFTDCEM